MKNLLGSISICFLCYLSLHAQQTQYQWAKTAGGSFITGGATANNQILSSIVDKEGNTYISGNVVEGMTFGDSILHPPYGSFGDYDGMVAKYDKCGKLLWSQVFGGSSNDYTGYLTLSTAENSLITFFNVSASHSSPVVFHMEGGDTVVNSGYGFFVKLNITNGKIIKLWPINLPYPTGATYQPYHLTYLSPNRLLCFISVGGNYNGSMKSGSEGILAILDSNLTIIRSHQIDSGMYLYYANDYDIDRPPLEVDKYGNIYNEVVQLPSDPSNVLHLFDTVFTGLNHGEGIFFQMDTNFNVKRFKKEKSLITSYLTADDNVYVTGGLDSNYYYDQTRFYVPGTTNRQMPIYMKIDTSLNLLGYSFPEYDQYVHYTNLIKATTDKVYVGGLGFSNIKWGHDSIVSIPNKYQMSIWEFPKDSFVPTKVHLSQEFDINSVTPENIGTDEQGNVIIGGTYGNYINTIGGDIYAAGGSNSPNIFILQWGLDCTDSTHSLIAPLEPATLVATATGMHSVQVTWQDESRYEHSFHIYRSLTGTGSWTRIDTVSANTTQYIDVNVQPHTIYWYRVAAWNENGESFSNIDSALTWTNTGIAETNTNLPYITAYPNPATSSLAVEAYSLTAQEASLSVTDINGRRVSDIHWPLTEGQNKTELQMGGIASGIYLLTIQTPTDIITRKITKIE